MKTFLAIMVPTFTVIALLEITLRILPGLIPLFLLQHFQDDLRLEIADRLGLPSRSKVREFHRDDGGPTLRTYLSQINLQLPFDDPDAVQSVQLDENGFCNSAANSYELEHINILNIGDSFTFCTAILPHQTWSAELSRLANLSTYNLGIPGIGPYEYLQLLKHFGLKKKPDIVVLNIYEGNDLRDVYRYHNYRSTRKNEGGTTQSETYPLLKQLLSTTIVKNSYAANLAVSSVIEAREAIHPPISEDKRHKKDIKKKYINFRYGFNFGEEVVPFNINNADKDEVVHALLLHQKTLTLEPFEDAMLNFVQLARHHEFIPIVAYTPSAYTAYAEFVRFEDEKLNTVMPKYSRDLRQYFSTGASHFGYHFIDLTLALQDAARSFGPTRLLYFPANRHLSVEGNKVVAKALWDYIETLM